MASWQGWIVVCYNNLEEEEETCIFTNLDRAIQCIEKSELGNDHCEYLLYKACEMPFDLIKTTKLKFKEGYDGCTIPKNSTNSKRCNR